MLRAQYDLSSILQKLPGDSIGENLIYSTIYDDIKRLRNTDDNWAKIEEITINALSTKSKDLQIVGWLLEALVVLDGLQGLCVGIKFLTDFINAFWDICYPLIETNKQNVSQNKEASENHSDIEQKFRILEWIYEILNKKFILTQLCGFSLYEYNYALELQSLILKSPKQTDAILQQASSMKKINDINQIIQETSVNDIENIISKFNDIKLQCINLQNVLQNIRNQHVVFNNLLSNINRISHLFSMKLHKGEKIETGTEPWKTKTNRTNREDIYNQLQILAKALEEIDRHSPSPYLLKLIINWQNKSLLEIITDLKTGNSDAHQLLKLLLA